MPSEMNSRSKRASIALWSLVLVMFIVGLLTMCLTGCTTTITPPKAVPSTASWDGTNQNSGVVCLTTNAQGSTTGAIITDHALLRYRSLMADYGKAWQVKGDEGLVWLPNGGQTVWIDAQHLDYFITANRWRKNGRPPDK